MWEKVGAEIANLSYFKSEVASEVESFQVVPWFQILSSSIDKIEVAL